MTQKTQLIKAKKLQKDGKIADLILKDQYRQEINTSVLPVLLSQYATALTDSRLANILPSSFDEKSRLPQPLLFALLKLQLDSKRFEVVLKMLLAHIDRKSQDNRHILLYNLSKVWSWKGETAKQIFVLQTLLKEVPFFSWGAYDLALCLSKDNTRIPEALALLERHLHSPNSENAIIHAGLINLASRVHLPVKNLLRMLHNKSLTLSNHFNLGVYFMKKGQIQSAGPIFTDLVQRLETLEEAEPHSWKAQDNKLLILSKINIVKIRHKLGCKDSARLASSLIDIHKANLDADTISLISSFKQNACTNSKQDRLLTQQGFSPNQAASGIKQYNSHKENSFDYTYAQTRRRNNCKLQYLLKKEKNIDQFFKDLKLKGTGDYNRWKVILSGSIKSAQQQLQEGRSSYSRGENGQEELNQIQQSFEFKKQVQECRFSGMNIQQIIHNILYRLDTINSPIPTTLPAKKQPRNEALNRIHLKQIESSSKVPFSGHSPLHPSTVSNCVKIPQKPTAKPVVVSQLKPAKSSVKDKPAARESKQLISLQKSVSDRNLSKFRIKPTKTHPPVQNSAKIKQNLTKKSLLDNTFIKKANYKHANDEEHGNQRQQLKASIDDQKRNSNLNLQQIKSNNQKQKLVEEAYGERQVSGDVEESKVSSSKVEDRKEPTSEPEAREKSTCEPQKQLNSNHEICVLQAPAHESADQLSEVARQISIPQIDQIEYKNQAEYLGPVLSPLDFIQPFSQDLPTESNAGQIQQKQFTSKNIQPTLPILETEILQPLACQLSNEASQHKISEREQTPKPLQTIQTKLQQIISQQAQSLPHEQGASLKLCVFDPFASTFNLTGFANTQLNDFSGKPSASISNTFNIFEHAFGMKPCQKPEPSSQEFQANMLKIKALEDQGLLEEAYSKLRQLYKQFKGEKEKTRILLKIGQIFEKQNKLLEAEKTYAKCTKFNSAEAFLALGSLQLKINKIEEGVENLQKANCLKRFDLQIQNRLVYGYSMREQTMDKALNLAHNILKKQPNSLETLLITAGILQRQGKLQQAIQIVAAMDEVRKAQYVKHYLGILYLQSSNLKEAFKCFKSALAMKPDYVPSLIEVASIISEPHPHEAIAILNKVLQLSTGNRKALARLGKIYEAECDFENAMVTYKIGLESQANYQSYMKIGDCLYKKESYIEALLNYKQALNLKKTHEAYAKVALMYELKGQHSRAIQYYQSALSVVGQTPQVWETRRSNLMAIGRLNVLLGQYEAAISSLEEDELIQGQTSIDVLQLLGEAYLGNKQYSIALNYLEKANNLTNGSNVQILQTMAMCFDRMEEYLASKAIYERIIEKNPDNLRCLNNLANILLITGQTNEAFYLFESLLEKSPKNLEKRLKVADIYAEVGDWSKVEYHLLQCYRQRQHDSRILQKLVLLYKQKRDGKMAAKYEKKLALVRASHKNKNA